MSDAALDYVLTDHVAILTINRPEKHNSITPQMGKRLQQLCRELDDNAEVRAVIIRGAGDNAFCAGSDIGALETYGTTWEFRNRTDYVSAIRNMKKPCIAALKGWVLGGGLEIALAADIRVADRSAQFGAPEVKLGWVGAGGASQMLPRICGMGQAMRILLTGTRIDANEALRIGLIEELVDKGNEDQRTLQLAQLIAEARSEVTQSVKACVRISASAPLEAGLKYENEMMILNFAMGLGEDGKRNFAERKS